MDSINQIEVKGAEVVKEYTSLLNENRNRLIDEYSKFSKKHTFTFSDIAKLKNKLTEQDKVWFDLINFCNKPIKNQYYIYCKHYEKYREKLPESEFKHDLKKLNDYYSKIDKNDVFSFNKSVYLRYVIYVTLKLKGLYKSEYDKILHVKQGEDHKREYNPATSVPSVMRGELPYDIFEYDISRAHPTFLAIKHNLEVPTDIYERVSKQSFAIAVNAHKDSKVSLKVATDTMNKVFGKNNIIDIENYNNKGKLFKELCEVENEYIEKFVSENKLSNFVRLHDGILLLKGTEIKTSEFGKVSFKIKECVKPKIERVTYEFYEVNDLGAVSTEPYKYTNFLQHKNFIRVYSLDDKIQVIKNENNVVEFYNHNTELPAFLHKHILEYDHYSAVINHLAKDSHILYRSLFHLPNIKLEYHKDTKDTFGLLFKNGYFEIEKAKEPTLKELKENQFFAKHQTQNIEFEYSDKVGVFETFIERVATGKKDETSYTDEDKLKVKEFCSMIGYMCHNFKSPVNSPAIILSDVGANGINRNGGRGKSLITEAVRMVQKSIFKGSNSEFDPNYQFNWDDLDISHNAYIIDDVKYNFKYDDLYTNILGSISAHRKGKKAETIEFDDTPKFMITTNWVVMYDEQNTSTNRRFIEYQLTDYYNKDNKPENEFGCMFFKEWNAIEWNKFYSFIFNCVNLYLSEGVLKPIYDKAEDNQSAMFINDVMFTEFERIFNIISQLDIFNVNDFITEYNKPENGLRFEKLFNQNNVKKLINQWIMYNKLNINYIQRSRKWIRTITQNDTVF